MAAAMAAVVGMAGAAGVVSLAAPASAHPLGNFTVNRYARLEVSAGVLRVYYVLDEAEIPAFQERGAVHSDREGFGDRRAREIAAGLSLTIDGAPTPLRVQRRLLTEPVGQAGLPTLRLEVLLDAALPARAPEEPHTAVFADSNEADRVGWREIVVASRGDARILRSDAPARDLSDELRSYPADLTQAPLDLRQARFAFTPGTIQVNALPVDGPTSAPARSGDRFTALITRRDLTPLVVAGMLGVAMLFGVAHAMAPGHGKTVMAAYLVGTRGRPRDAVLVGVIVALMHTVSVLALGVVLFQVSRSTSLDSVYPVLTLVSGVAVIGVGAWLLRSRLRTLRRAGHGDGHGHGEGHGDGHRHGPGTHTHDPEPGVAPLSRRGLVVLATSGGIIPSPSAVIVIVSAFTLDRVAMGLALVGAFSMGLAAALSAVGLAMVFGRHLAERRGMQRALRLLPAVGAAALVVLGVVLVVQGLRTLR